MHRNAPLTPQGRLRLCQMIEEGWTIDQLRRVHAHLAPDHLQESLKLNPMAQLNRR